MCNGITKTGAPVGFHPLAGSWTSNTMNCNHLVFQRLLLQCFGNNEARDDDRVVPRRQMRFTGNSCWHIGNPVWSYLCRMMTNDSVNDITCLHHL